MKILLCFRLFLRGGLWFKIVILVKNVLCDFSDGKLENIENLKFVAFFNIYGC